MAKNPRDKAGLEMTAEDHAAIGSTPPKDLRENPGKNLADLMDDEKLRAFMDEQVKTVADVFDMVKAGGTEQQMELLRLTRDGFLAPNLAYLREIGRLPAEFADLDPMAKFNLGDIATVKVVHHPAGIRAGCIKCQTLIASGTFAVGVEIGLHRYLVGNAPPKLCCGEEKKVPLLYDDEASADAAVQNVIAALKRDGDTSKMRLLGMAKFISTAQH